MPSERDDARLHSLGNGLHHLGVGLSLSLGLGLGLGLWHCLCFSGGLSLLAVSEDLQQVVCAQALSFLKQAGALALSRDLLGPQVSLVIGEPLPLCPQGSEPLA